MWCTTVYASNSLDQRRKLWGNIENLQTKSIGLWLVIGDYNNVLSVNDIIVGNPVSEKEF